MDENDIMQDPEVQEIISGGGAAEGDAQDSATGAQNQETPAEGQGPAPDAVATEGQPFQGYEFDYNGKPVKVAWNDPKAKTWAQQGYDYSQRVSALKAERQKWEGERSEFETKSKPYRELEEYARQNPEWLKHVQEAFRLRQIQRPGQELSPEIKALKDEIDGFKEFKSQLESQITATQKQADDEALDRTIQSVREKYKDLDWVTEDANGQNLEARVLDHAVQNGIKSFQAAFRDLHHDDLIRLAEQKGKETLAKEREAKAKTGIIGRTPTPTKVSDITAAKNPKAKTYDDLAREALAEIQGKSA